MIPDLLDVSMPSRVIVAPGAVDHLEAATADHDRVLLVTSPSVRERACDALVTRRLVGVVEVRGEPDLTQLEARVSTSRPLRPGLVVGVGGGSVIDTAKVLAAMVPNRSELGDHLEVVGRSRPLEAPPLPLVAVPSTFGTGSEMTCNAVIGLPDEGRKVSLRDRRLTPVAALVDPDLGRGVRPATARAAGFDAVVQLVEAAATPRSGSATRAVALAGAQLAMPALAELVREGGDGATRHALAYGACCSGFALANARLGTVHGFAGVLGGLVPVPHGVLCAAFAAPVIRATVAALRDGNGEADRRALATYGTLAGYALGPSADAEDLAEWFSHLARAAHLDTTGLGELRSSDPEPIVSSVRVASSTDGNPVALSRETLLAILDGVLP